jgi:hypothetical protein
LLRTKQFRELPNCAYSICTCKSCRQRKPKAQEKSESKKIKILDDFNLFNLQKLHDAILISIDLKWKEKEVTVVIQTNEASFKEMPLLIIKAEKTKRAEVNLNDPWGRSIYINGVEYFDGSPAKLNIEMQSGDLILFEAENFQIFMSEK